MEIVSTIDVWVLTSLNGFVGRDVAFDRFAVTIAELALLKGVVIIGLFWWIWFQRRSALPSQETRDPAVFVLRTIAVALIAIAVGRALQWWLPYRPSPMNDASLGLSPVTGTRGWFSLAAFPSDHAIVFFALATGLWLWSRWLGAFAFAWVAIVICLPRIYIGRHYPSDILGGAMIGIVLMLLAHRLQLLTRPAKLALRWEHAHPASFYMLAFVVCFEIAILFDSVRLLGNSLADLVNLRDLVR